MTPVNKLLIIRLSSLGDIILTYPLIKRIKNEIKGVEIHFLVKEKFSDVVMLNPNIDKVRTLEGKTITMHRKEIREEKYDLVLDIHKNIRSHLLTIFNRTEIKRYKKDTLKKLLLCYFKINMLKNSLPVFGKYMRTLFKDASFDFTLTELATAELSDFKKPYTILAPSSKHYTKIYPKEKFANYISKKKNKLFILTGDNSERDIEICSYLERECGNTINICGKTSLKELAGLLKGSEEVICNDSGILHMAEALGKKVTALFGSTTKEIGFYPQLITSRVVEAEGLKCRPCHNIGREKCPKGHFDCMETIDLN